MCGYEQYYFIELIHTYDYAQHCHHFIELIHMYDYEWYCHFRNGHVRHVEASVTAVSVVAGEAKGAPVYSFTWRAKGATMMSTLTSEGQLHIICMQNKLVWVLQASSNSVFYIGEGSVCVCVYVLYWGGQCVCVCKHKI